MRKPQNKHKRLPLKSPQQRQAIKLITEALLSSKPFSITSLLVQAGYSEESASQYTNIMTALKPHLDPVVQKIERLRDRAIERLDDEDVIKGARYSDLVNGIEKLTKTARLLGGKSTANVAVIAERRRELDELIDD